MSDLIFSTICPHCDELFNDSVEFMTHEGQCEYEANLKRAYQIGNLIDDYYEPINGRASESSKKLDKTLKDIAKSFDLSSEVWDDDYELRQKELRQLFEIISGYTKPISVGFKRLDERATIPTRAHPTDSGFDLYALEDTIIEPNDTAIVKTGIAVELPPGYEAQIRPRSGVTAHSKLRVQLGTIDIGYRGEIGVIVDNIFLDVYAGVEHKIRLIDGTERDLFELVEIGTYKIRKGDRIAQIVIQRLPETDAVEITEFSEDSERGADGFGSSGV